MSWAPWFFSSNLSAPTVPAHPRVRYLTSTPVLRPVLRSSKARSRCRRGGGPSLQPHLHMRSVHLHLPRQGELKVGLRVEDRPQLGQPAKDGVEVHPAGDLHASNGSACHLGYRAAASPVAGV
jgi:hypothetical protein